MIEVFVAGLIYAALALDHIAVGQFMFSRPLVVGPLIGLYLGDPLLGLLAGGAVELLWVHVIPVGIWPIDTSAVAGLAVTWAALSSRPGRAALVIALFLAVPCGVAVRRIDIRFRRMNSRYIPRVLEGLEAGDEGVLGRAVALSLVQWFLKAWALFAAMGLAGWGLVELAVRVCPDRLFYALDFAGRALPLLALCVVLNYFIDRRRAAA